MLRNSVQSWENSLKASFARQTTYFLRFLGTPICWIRGGSAVMTWWRVRISFRRFSSEESFLTWVVFLLEVAGWYTLITALRLEAASVLPTYFTTSGVDTDIAIALDSSRELYWFSPKKGKTLTVFATDLLFDWQFITHFCCCLTYFYNSLFYMVWVTVFILLWISWLIHKSIGFIFSKMHICTQMLSPKCLIAKNCISRKISYISKYTWIAVAAISFLLQWCEACSYGLIWRLITRKFCNKSY